MAVVSTQSLGHKSLIDRILDDSLSMKTLSLALLQKFRYHYGIFITPGFAHAMYILQTAIEADDPILSTVISLGLFSSLPSAFELCVLQKGINCDDETIEAYRIFLDHQIRVLTTTAHDVSNAEMLANSAILNITATWKTRALQTMKQSAKSDLQKIDRDDVDKSRTPRAALTEPGKYNYDKS